MLAELAPGTTIAGVLTQSKTPGAPVDWCRACLPDGSVRTIVVNSGNANVFTGRAGREVCERTAAAAAELFGCSPREVFISSTGLAYLFTDAALPATVLQPLLKEAADKSFNCVTVDGDTSTSDTVLLCATGQAKNAAITNARDPRLADFRRALAAVSIDLAQQLARDGEGAEKFVTIEVTGAENDRAARRIGLSIGNSPLVKTAIAAADANWGRVVMAVGKAGEKAERDRLSISVGGIQIAAEGGPVPGYREGPVSEHM